jgi:hypothetical protein
MDYAERIEDALLVFNGEFSTADSQAVEILLAARVDCPLPYPWLVLETACYRVDTEGCWFSQIFDQVLSLPILRVSRPRHANQEVQELLRERETARLFIEPNYTLPTAPKYLFTMWEYLVQECVRLRVEYPKNKLTDERSCLMARAAVERVMDSRWRAVGSNRLPTPPSQLYYYTELLQKLNPHLRDWECLLTNLCCLAGRRAYLFNREVDETDWRAVARVMRDSVPVWTGEIATHVDRRGTLTSLRGKYDQRLIEKEVRSLASNGILYRVNGEWRMRDLGGRGADVVGLIKEEEILAAL